jgi:hypothetical protein
MKSQIIQSVKIIILALVIGLGASYISAQTPPPCSSPSGCNVAAPINESGNAQTKLGGLGVASDSGETFVSFGKSYLLRDTYVGSESLSTGGGESSPFPANLFVFGNVNASGHGAFGNYDGGNYLEVGHDGAHSYIDGKNSGDSSGSGLLLNYYAGGPVAIGGGTGGASNLNVSGNVKINTLASASTQTICADTVGKLVPCAIVPPPTPTTLHTQIYSRSGGSQVTSGSLGSSNSSSFTVPANVTKINVRIWAAGGGGGGKSDWHEGGGGGGGGFAQGTLVVTPGTVFNITVGAGGSAGSNVNNSQTDGSQGGASIFGTVANIFGGGGGKKAPLGAGSQAWGGLGGLGALGTVSGGLERSKGSDGSIGGSNCQLTFPASSCGNIPDGGNSGFALSGVSYGKGGHGGYLDPVSTNSVAGSDGRIEVLWEE